MAELGGRSLDLGDVALPDGRPPRDARLYGVAEGVEGNVTRVLGCQWDSLRAGADPAHLALENVEDLRQLIDPVLADDAPHARDPAVAAGRETWTRPVGTHVHGAKLEALEMSPAVANAHLSVEHRPRAVELDGGSRKRENDECQREGQDGCDDVDDALNEQVGPLREEGVEADVARMLQVNFARHQLLGAPAVVDRRPARRASYDEVRPRLRDVAR